jgi:hypothetical protein
MKADPVSCAKVCDLIEKGSYDERTVVHIRQCQGCFERALEALLRSGSAGAAPSRFASTVLAQCESRSEFSASAGRSGGRGVWLVMAAMAAVFLAVLYAQNWRSVTESLSVTVLLALGSIEITLIMVWVVLQEPTEWVTPESCP